MRLAILSTFLIATIGRAQVPAGPPPSPGSLIGVVQDVNGTPVGDISVSLMGEALATRTDSLGRFLLLGVAAGNHTALFRRIGYRSVEYRFTMRPGAELELTVTIAAMPRQLELVVVEAPSNSRRHGTSSIGGIVLDSADFPVIGADVRLLATGLETVTDSSGRFKFAKIAAGAYMVRARRHGHASRNHIMQLATDDDRNVTLKLSSLPKAVGVRDTARASGYGAADDPFNAFDRRERAGGNPMLGPGDLFRANGAPMDFVLQSYRDAAALTRRTRTVREGRGPFDDSDCLIVDGKRAVFQPLRTYTSRDVQLVEVLRRHALVDPWVVSQMDAINECRGSMDDHPIYFMLWTRFLR